MTQECVNDHSKLQKIKNTIIYKSEFIQKYKLYIYTKIKIYNCKIFLYFTFKLNT